LARALSSLPTRRSADLADFPAGSPGRLQSDLAFRAAGLARDVRYEAATPGLIVDVVAAGLAVALLPQTFARPAATTSTIKPGVRSEEHTSELQSRFGLV